MRLDFGQRPWPQRPGVLHLRKPSGPRRTEFTVRKGDRTLEFAPANQLDLKSPVPFSDSTPVRELHNSLGPASYFRQPVVDSLAGLPGDPRLPIFRFLETRLPDRLSRRKRHGSTPTTLWATAAAQKKVSGTFRRSKPQCLLRLQSSRHLFFGRRSVTLANSA
jgi:hypothetical protein